MKITLFTSNNVRHNYLINLLSNISDELFVVQECETIFPGEIPGHYPTSIMLREYFKKVSEAQYKFFDHSLINNFKKNVKNLSIAIGDLNKCSLEFLSDFLKSDIYVVFGASYIKGDLIDFLLKNKTINIHMGVSPYYKGCDCNFWALYDNNPHLVGSTIHLIQRGLDNGPILYHSMSNIKTTPFEYTMSTVKSALHSVAERLKDNSIFDMKPEVQKEEKKIRYSTKIQFNEKIISDYFSKKINLNSKEFDNSLLIRPFYLDN